jgi:hypothetical protein
MYESREVSDVAVGLEVAKRASGQNSIRSFCKSLFRRVHLGQPRPTREQDEADGSAPLQTCQPVQRTVNRVTQRGRFDWGSFSAFEDGSIEVERAGVTQWFPNFSELKRSLNQRAEN